MGGSILLMTALVCAPTIIIKEERSISIEEMTKRELRDMRGAKIRCSFKFPNSPCLKRFEIVAPRTYRAICTAEEK